MSNIKRKIKKQKEKSSFPTIKQLNKNFDILITENLSTTSIGVVKKKVNEAFNFPPTYTQDILDEFTIIRARQLDEENEDITNPETFKAAPIMYTGQGRANLIGYPVFYATTDSQIAMQEIKADHGSECYLSIWEKPADINLTLALLMMDADKDNSHHHLIKSGREIATKQFGLKGKKLDVFIHAMRLHSQLFTLEDYNISSKIAHDIIYFNSIKSNGIIYPSVIDNLKCNFAIHPEYIEKNFKLKRCYKMINNNSQLSRVLSRGIVTEKEIIWEDTGKWERDELDNKYFI